MMDERTRLTALTVVGTSLLLVPLMYGVNRLPRPDGTLETVVGGGPSWIGFGAIVLTLGLAWVTSPFVPVRAVPLFWAAPIALAIGLAVQLVGLTDWWVQLRTERVEAGHRSFALWLEIPVLVFGQGAALLFAIAGAKRLREAIKSPAVKRPRLR
jgi:hypothetical protein